jgi:hypothetical protein
MYTTTHTPHMPRKQQVQTRIAEDTNQTLESYQEEHGLSQADALRRLTRTGLIAQGYDIPTADGGRVLDRLDQLEEQQNERLQEVQRRQYTLGIGIVSAVLYLLATVTLEVSSTVWWSMLGAGLLAAIVAYRVRHR